MLVGVDIGLNGDKTWIFSSATAFIVMSSIEGKLHRGKVISSRWSCPVERWACDLASPFPTSTKGYVYILTAVCVSSKYIVLVPLRDKFATTIARAIMNNVFLKYGAGEILTDNGLEFRNELLSELCRLMGLARCFTTSYQPRTNAVCECSHATVNSMLAKCVADNHRD